MDYTSSWPQLSSLSARLHDQSGRQQFGQRFLTEICSKKTLSKVSGFHDQSVLKFDQCFYLKLPLGGKFKDKQNDYEKMFDWSILIKVHQIFQKNRMGCLFRQIRQSQATFFDKVFDAGLDDQKTL